MGRNSENYKKCHKSIGMTTKSKENVKMYAKYSKKVKRYWPENVKQLPFFLILQWSRFVFAESKIWIKCNQIETFGFWSLQSNYWMVHKQSKYWMVQNLSKYWIAFHESKFWIACSNYRLNHPMYGLLEHKTEVVFL